MLYKLDLLQDWTIIIRKYTVYQPLFKGLLFFSFKLAKKAVNS